jgi:hypothetical protein
MVWAMRIMTRYHPILARAVIALVIRSEVIACGLRDDKGVDHIYFSPQQG